MVMLELVDYNENLLKESKTTKAKTIRRGRTKKSDVVETKAEAVVEQLEETPTNEEKVEEVIDSIEEKAE